MNLFDIKVAHDHTAAAASDTPATRRRWPIAFMAAALLLLLPVVLWGYPVTSHDSMVHVRWQQFYTRQLWQGDLFPRWLRDMNDGMGSPAFFIYPPLPHYVAALLGPLSDTPAWVQRRLGLATLLACVVGSVGCYAWLRQVTRERNSALIGALIYLMAPYHLFLDIYYRGAYAEVWAFTWAPFMLGAIHLFPARRCRGIVMYTLAASALLFSHAPSALVMVPLCLLYAGLAAWVMRRPAIVWWTAVCTGTAILLSGAYLATALTQQSYIDSGALFSSRFFDLMLFAPSKVSQAATSTTVIVQTCITLALGIAPLRAGARAQRWLAWTAVLGTAGIFFLTTTWSAPLWHLVPAAQKIQFSWRLMAAQTVLLALAATLHLRTAATATGLAILPRKWAEPVLLASFVVLNAGLHALAQPAYHVDLAARGGEVGEYRLTPYPLAARYFAGDRKIAFTAGTGSATLRRWDPRRLAFHVDAAGPAELVIKQSAYTGWTCQSLTPGGHCDVAASARPGDLVRIRTSAGAQDIELTMAPTPQEHAGTLASACGVLVLLALAATTRHAGRPRRAARPVPDRGGFAAVDPLAADPLRDTLG